MTTPPRREQRFGGESGTVSLVELITVSILAVATLALAGLLVQVAVRAQPRISERAAQIQEGRVLMERLTRELRIGYGVRTAASSELVFLTFSRRTTCGGSGAPPPTTPAIPCQVSYECEAGTCFRRETDPDGSLPQAGVEMVRGLASDSVFGYLPSPAGPEYVSVRLEFPAESGDDAITLEDGVNLRNSS